MEKTESIFIATGILLSLEDGDTYFEILGPIDSIQVAGSKDAAMAHGICQKDPFQFRERQEA